MEAVGFTTVYLVGLLTDIEICWGSTHNTQHNTIARAKRYEGGHRSQCLDSSHDIFCSEVFIYLTRILSNHIPVDTVEEGFQVVL